MSGAILRWDARCCHSVMGSHRMISEMVLVDELKDDDTMNIRKEWSFVKLDKVAV